jgi:hypothetical protein
MRVLGCPLRRERDQLALAASSRPTSALEFQIHLR